MNVTAVSIYSHSRANNLKGKQEHPSNFSPKKSAAPSFGDAWLGKLSEQEIKSLYGDGKKLWALMSEAIPVLGKKVGDMLSVRIDLHPDVLRYMSVHVKTEHNKMDEMLDYIVKNNDKKFGFPKPLIDSFKKHERNFTDWLNNEDFIPFKQEIDIVGYDKARKDLMDFSNKANLDGFIKAMYKLDPPRSFVKEKAKEPIPSYYWEFIGG